MTSLDELRFWIHNQRSAAKNILDPHAMLAGRPVGVTDRETAQSVLAAIPAMEEIAEAVEAGKEKLHEAIEKVKTIFRKARQAA
jgi:hypothetical protein